MSGTEDGASPHIVVCHWERFQHYKDRNPPWIKTYTELLSSEAYLRLTGHRRAILHGLWLDYATKSGELTDDTLMISRRLSLKVTTSDLRALEDAGFIALPSHTAPNLASSVLAKRLQRASASRALARDRDREEAEDLTPEGSLVSEKSKVQVKTLRGVARETDNDDGVPLNTNGHAHHLATTLAAKIGTGLDFHK